MFSVLLLRLPTPRHPTRPAFRPTRRTRRQAQGPSDAGHEKLPRSLIGSIPMWSMRLARRSRLFLVEVSGVRSAKARLAGSSIAPPGRNVVRARRERVHIVSVAFLHIPASTPIDGAVRRRCRTKSLPFLGPPAALPDNRPPRVVNCVRIVCEGNPLTAIIPRMGQLPTLFVTEGDMGVKAFWSFTTKRALTPSRCLQDGS